MKVVQMTVTPTQAREWLENSLQATNRRITNKRVVMYADAMRAGHWKLTAQALSITEDGIIVDGQHRLAATVQYGQPVEFLVDLDADPATFDVIDNVKARTGTDVLHIAGYNNVNLFSAGLRLLTFTDAYREAAGSKTWQSFRTAQLAHSQLLELAESDLGPLIDSQLASSNRIAMAWGRWGARTPINVALSILARHPVPSDLRTEFAERLTDGAMLPIGSPILAVRRYFIGETGWILQSQTVRPVIGVAVLIKAYNSWVTGSDLQMVRYSVDREVFPAPVDFDPVAAERAALAREASASAAS